MTANPVRRSGQENQWGVSYYRARYYDPTRSRFVSEDPIGFDGGVNAYVYTLDGPLNWVDPLGLDVQICLRPMSGPPPFSDYPHTFLYSTNAKTGYGLGPKPGWEVLTPWMKVPGQIENDYPYDSSGRIKPQNQCTTESTDKCVEDCANRKARDATRRPPGYKLGTYQCDTWANDLLRQCKQECGK